MGEKEQDDDTARLALDRLGDPDAVNELTRPGEVLRELEAKLAEAADLGLIDSDTSGDRRRPK
jgi:hypothetical protein